MVKRTRNCPIVAFGCLFACVVFLFISACGRSLEEDLVKIRFSADPEVLLSGFVPGAEALFEALQEFAEAHDTRCRANIKRVDQWACEGPHGMYITFREDLGEDTFTATFALVIFDSEHAAQFERYVQDFADAMEARFPGTVEYPVRP